MGTGPNHFSDACNFQRFTNAAKQRIPADLHFRAWSSNCCEEPLEQRPQEILVFAKIFGNDEDVQFDPSPPLLFPSVKLSAVSIQPPASRPTQSL